MYRLLRDRVTVWSGALLIAVVIVASAAAVSSASKAHSTAAPVVSNGGAKQWIAFDPDGRSIGPVQFLSKTISMVSTFDRERQIQHLLRAPAPPDLRGDDRRGREHTVRRAADHASLRRVFPGDLSDARADGRPQRSSHALLLAGKRRHLRRGHLQRNDSEHSARLAAGLPAQAGHGVPGERSADEYGREKSERQEIAAGRRPQVGQGTSPPLGGVPYGPLRLFAAMVQSGPEPEPTLRHDAVVAPTSSPADEGAGR